MFKTLNSVAVMYDLRNVLMGMQIQNLSFLQNSFSFLTQFKLRKSLEHRLTYLSNIVPFSLVSLDLQHDVPESHANFQFLGVFLNSSVRDAIFVLTRFS